MGVPKFFRYMSERYPCLSELVKDYQIPEFDNMYLDMNGIIHNCSHPNDDDPHFRISEEAIIKNIFHYLEVLFQMIQPQKLFFMAIDGVAPRAKMNQQRGRRFRAAQMAADQTKEATDRGETLPSEQRFDSNCITPGTPFMVRLQNELEHFVTDKVSNDPLWKNVEVILSGHQVPGEGEHKIMDYIRYMKAKPGYNCQTRHCLYGLDADLIMLGLCTHEPYFSLLREEVKFGRNAKKETSVDETQFYLLHLSLMRDYLELEFNKLKETLPFHFDLESIIDDWVLMGFLVGNDFIPHLPDLHISKGALPILYKVYMEVLPKLSGYLNEKGTLNLKRFQTFMETLANFDYEQFRDTFADIKYLESKRSANIPTNNKNDDDAVYKAELDTLIKNIDIILLSDDEEELVEDEDEALMAEFSLHKENYYRTKLDYNVVTDDVMRSQAEGYIRALQWNLNYYYNGCCSWSWFYPHHYAPYISDIKNFEHLKIEFDLGQPFLPFQQLLAVLPSLSKDLLPKPYQDLMTEEGSPILSYYPKKFLTDLNGKQHEWEAVVLIPFIDEQALIKAMNMVEHKLTEEEKKRNTHGPMHCFKFTENNLGLVSTSKHFPPIEESHAIKTPIYREEFAVKIDDLIKGLCPGLQMDVYHIGFPSLHLIPITAQLQKRGVKVFQSPSMGDNMILNIVKNDNESKLDSTKIQSIAKELLGNTLYVNWPHLEEMKIIAVSNTVLKITLNEEEQLIVRSMSESDVQEFNLISKGIAKSNLSSRGIEIGKTDVLLCGQSLRGTKYIPRQDGSGVDLIKVWSEISSTIAYQTAVPGLEVIDPKTKLSYFALEEYFPVGSTVFVLDAPYYGCQANVVGGFVASRIKINITLEAEPCFKNLQDALDSAFTELLYANVAASKLAINSHLFAKITGTIFLMIETYEDRNKKKINIGMNLKSNKRNEEVVGYTKIFENTWMYSIKTINLLGEYIEKFPEIINVLLKTDSAKDTFKSEDMFPDPNTRKQKLEDLQKWLGEMRALTKDKQTCGSMEPCKVAALNKYIDKFTKENYAHKRIMTLSVKSQYLFKPVTKLDKINADEGTETQILDRVVCVRSSYQVPLGLKGTIISIASSKSNNDIETVYSVLFDKEFPSGMTFGGSTKRGYKVCRMSFINLSHAIRINKYKPLSLKNKKETNHTSNSEKQNTQMSVWEHLQSSANGVANIKPQEEQITLALKESWRRSQRRELASVDQLTRILQPSMETVNNKLNNTLKQNQKLNAEASAFTLKKMLKIVPEDNLVQDRNQITNNDSYLNNAERYLPEPSIDGLKKNESHGWNYKTDGQIDGHSVSKLNHVLNTEEQQEKITMVMALETFYRQKGFKNPKYCYINLSDNKGNKVYCAELILPNGRTLRGEPKNSYSEASEDLAFRALNIVQDMKLHQNDHLRDLVVPSSSSLYADPKPTPHIEPPSVFDNWISSYRHCPVFQPSPPLTTQKRQQPIGHGKQPIVHSQQPIVHSQQPIVHSQQPIVHGQQPIVHGQQPMVQHHQRYTVHGQQQPIVHSKRPQCGLERTRNSQFRPFYQPYQSYQPYHPPSNQVTAQQPFCGVPFQQVYRQPSHAGYPLQPQPYVNYQQNVRFPNNVPGFNRLVSPSRLPQPPVHWQLNRNTVSNEFPANPAPNTYFQPQQYTPNTSNDVSMNEQYMTNDRITIPSPSSAFTSAANPSDQFMSNRKVKVAANFNTSQS